MPQNPVPVDNLVASAKMPEPTSGFSTAPSDRRKENDPSFGAEDSPDSEIAWNSKSLRSRIEDVYLEWKVYLEVYTCPIPKNGSDPVERN